ncbi:MAG: response regulator [Eubacteriales bacterium]|nr:response regulator [Eubacteriales bacterium]
MISVLIVDDEVHCAEGVRCSTDWESLGVDQVFTAYSMKQAIRVLEEHEIEIVLTDVEMPKGSGLDLLEWIRDHGRKPVTILLTSYAQFNYAKQAIELGVLDYLLKPIEQQKLYDVFQKAVEQIHRARETREIHRRMEYWTAAEKDRLRTFWRRVLEREIDADSRVIREQAAKEHLVFHENYLCMPVLFRIHKGDSQGNWLNRTEELKDELKKTVFQDWNQVVPAYREDRLLAIVEKAEGMEEYRRTLLENCSRFIKNCREELGIVFSCYVGEFREPGELAVQYELLEKADGNNVAERSGVYGMENADTRLPYVRPDIEGWMRLLARREYDKAMEEIEHDLRVMIHERRIDRGVLHQLCHDFTQAFYGFLEDKGFLAHQLLEDETAVTLYQYRGRTVEDFLKWSRSVIEKARNSLEESESQESVVSRTKRYIDSHLGEELNRNTLAGQAYMSADYLSRIFQQEMGMKLSEYITRARMEKAAKLLEETDLTVGEIADQVGYANLAYFTKVFRERNHTTPAQYRSDLRKGRK